MKKAATRKFWEGERGNAFRGLDDENAIELLAALNLAKSLKDLIRDGNPTQSTLTKVKGAMGLQLNARAVPAQMSHAQG